MEEETKEVQPTIGEYQGKPILRIPTADQPKSRYLLALDVVWEGF
jgi:hypothetical protein